MQQIRHYEERVEIIRKDFFTIKQLRARQLKGLFLTKEEKSRILKNDEITRKSRLNQKRK